MDMQKKKEEFFKEYLNNKTVVGGLTVVNDERLWSGVAQLLAEKDKEVLEEIKAVGDSVPGKGELMSPSDGVDYQSVVALAIGMHIDQRLKKLNSPITNN